VSPGRTSEIAARAGLDPRSKPCLLSPWHPRGRRPRTPYGEQRRSGTPRRGRRMKRARALWAGACAALLYALVALVSPNQVTAATLTEVTNFGPNPGNLRMHIYVPNNVQPNPAIVLAMHPCGGSGPSFYSSTEFATLADRYGFIVIYPSASKKMNCFDNWSDESKVRGGQTDPVSLMSMVTYALQQ